jgi:hypothetical protein
VPRDVEVAMTIILPAHGLPVYPKAVERE